MIRVFKVLFFLRFRPLLIRMISLHGIEEEMKNVLRHQRQTVAITIWSNANFFFPQHIPFGIAIYKYAKDVKLLI